MSNPRLRLVTRWQNSAGERVRIALNLKGLAWEYVARGDLSAEAFERISPQGLLPVLLVRDEAVSQSAAILDYIEENYPGPRLLPLEPIARARARAFGACIAAEMHALTVSRVRTYLAGSYHVAEAEVGNRARHWLALGFEALERMVGESPRHRFCFSPAPGWAELHLVPQMAAARRLGCDLSHYPALLAVEMECVSLEAFRRALPENQPDYRHSTN